MQWIVTRMRAPGGGLLHRYRDGEPAIPAFGDDYAFTIKALIELYESTFDAGYLSTAIELNSWFVAHFHDKARGGFFTTSDSAEILLVRKKEIYDGAIPSCNSIAFENLVRLAHLTGDAVYEQQAFELSRTFSATVYQSPSAHSWFLCALDSAIGPVHDVVIVGDRDGKDTKELINGLREQYFPHVLIVFKQLNADDPLLSRLAPFTQNLKSPAGTATAYVCSGNACAVPVSDLHQLLNVFGRPSQLPDS